jgi:DNA-binding XRE family transcriptional regulator
VSEWNGTDATSIGVPARKTYSPKESAKVMALLDIAKEYGKAFNEDFKVNGEFYRAFNQWLESTRIKREKCL